MLKQDKVDEASKHKEDGGNEGKNETEDAPSDLSSEKSKQDGSESLIKKENGKDEEGIKEKLEVDGSGGKTVKQLQGVDIVNNMECKFNLNSYRMVYVVDSEDYMYRRSSLKKAREVSFISSGL